MAVILDPIDIKINDMKYGMNPNEEEFDHKLSKEIWDFLLKNCHNYKILSKKIRLRNDLSDLFSKYFNEISNGLKFVDLFISGSTLNGFATLDSDLDLCFVVEDNYQFEFCKSKKVKILSDIEEILDLNGFKLSDCQLIEARVPILRFIDSGSKIQVEINVNNEFGIRNTRLLYCYSKLDWRVVPIGIAIKRWAKHYGIIDSFNGVLSSYTVELMVIFYLQNCCPPILPCLQQTNPEMFDPNVEISSYKKLPDIRALVDAFNSRSDSRNDQSLAEVFIGFFHFYLNVFDFRLHVASVRTGKALWKDKFRPFRQDPNQWEWICVEEPFSRSNSGRTVYEGVSYMRIRETFKWMDKECKEIINIECNCD